jgi:hypothetical protein
MLEALRISGSLSILKRWEYLKIVNNWDIRNIENVRKIGQAHNI